MSEFSKKILLVEDEAALQKSLKEVLSAEGYNLISAMDGETGIELAKKEKPDLILLDLILPKLNGFEVLKKIKEGEETKNIPVVVLTNLEAMDDINKAISLGASSYLVKANYSLEDVSAKIKETLK